MTDSEYALLARFEAKPGKEAAVAQFLHDAREAAEAEPGMTTWFAVRFDESRFGIFDTFPDKAGRQEHLEGEIVTQLMERAEELFAEGPQIEEVDVLEAMHP